MLHQKRESSRTLPDFIYKFVDVANLHLFTKKVLLVCQKLAFKGKYFVAL